MTNLSEFFSFTSDAILFEKSDEIFSSSLEVFILRFLITGGHDLNTEFTRGGELTF